jgi:ABC-2 type transport system permease protein
VTSVAPVAPRAVSADGLVGRGRTWLTWYVSRILAFCIVEVEKLRHDRSELVTRAIQPALWLVVFGKTFSSLHAIPSGGVPYLDFLAPGVLAQSTLFVSVFYGIQVIWERDAGVLSKLMVTPTPRSALVTGKAFAAGMRALSQAVVVIVLSLVLGVALLLAPWRLLGAGLVAVLGAAFFASLSMTIAGLVLSRERLMGIGQAITMPLFFASNALYPIAVMPPWLQVIAKVNPLSYEVNALRGLLIGTPTNLWLDFGVLWLAVVVGILGATTVLPRLVR